jgi:hypothetical protein
MNLQLPSHLAAKYKKSAAQRARVVTEAWGADNLYCCDCPLDGLSRQAANTGVIDYLCPKCAERYQLKSQSKKIGSTMAGSNYQKMFEAIVAGFAPNFFLMHYGLPEWLVRDLLVVPKFTITRSAIVLRAPLRASARRKGWEGYTLDLRQIPSAAKIPLVTAGVEREPADVRADFARIAPVREMKTDQRGWTLDLLRCVEKFGTSEFTTEQSYEFESHLAALHPDNRHVRDKIRQQLQVLRDLGFLEHIEKGRWRRK